MVMKAVVAGGTGLIGSHLLELLSADAAYTNVVALARRPVKDLGSKVRWVVTNFDDEKELLKSVRGADVVFCCLGTTIKKAKTKEAFRKVDFDYVINLANAALAAGCKKFLVVSAIGSDPNSKVFYSRVKGEMENALKTIGFEQLSIFQPSMLTGARSEFRFGERIGIGIAKLIAPLMLGGLRKYRPIQARNVARSMVTVAKRDMKGISVLSYSEIVPG
jgi:uncharacterized protein YbjT (DUF2867 family)